MSPALAAAADPAATLSEQIQALQEALAQQQRTLQSQAEEIQRLRQQVQTLAESSAKPSGPTSGSETKPATETPRLSMTTPRPTLTSADGRNTFSPRAIVHFDMADYGEDSEGNPAADFRRGSQGGAGNRETNAARDFSDGAYFRRARLGFEGMIARDFNYRVLLELGGAGAEGPTRINDAWIAYTGFAPFTIQLGAYAPPANMDDGTSVDHLLFIERASGAEMSRALGGADGRLGLGIRASGPRWMGSFTLTGRTANDAEVFDSQLAAVARFGHLLATGTNFNVHTGVSGTWVFEPADLGSSASGPRTPLRLRERPEIRVDSTRLIDTGSIDADAAYVAGVEFGANWKNWYVQAENFWYGVERPAAAPYDDPTFGAYYVQGAWILTGETRRYDPASGAFQAPRATPGTSGVWELGLRYSHADLDFHAGAPGTPAALDSVRGGEQSIWTLGLNWYVNANVRFMLNYLRVDVDRLNPAGPGNLLPFGAAPATPPLGVQIGQSLDVYALRSQFSF